MYELSRITNLPSSRNVNRPICGKSLNVSKHTEPSISCNLTMATWSCLINLGFLVLSPVFLSIRAISIYRKQIEYYCNRTELKIFTTYENGYYMGITNTLELLIQLDIFYEILVAKGCNSPVDTTNIQIFQKIAT